MPLQIGNFKAVEAPQPEKDTQPATETTDSGLEQEALTRLEEKLADEALTPAERYRKRLEEANISLATASAVFDDLIAKGYHEKRVLIKGREAVLRTRTYEDHLRSVSAVEIAAPRFSSTQDELQARYNLAASLISWNGTIYKTATGDAEKEFNATMAVLKKMPSPIYALLLGELSKFDAQMFVIFSEGALENF